MDKGTELNFYKFTICLLNFDLIFKCMYLCIELSSRWLVGRGLVSGVATLLKVVQEVDCEEDLLSDKEDKDLDILGINLGPDRIEEYLDQHGIEASSEDALETLV